MEGSFQEFWRILTGIALLLLAVHTMEGSVAEISGRKFKLFLKRQTDNKLKTVATSVLITSVLQSSSLVNLVIMDMLGSGIVSLEQALALNLGANLGTTVNSWLVVLLGFNTNMENWVLPLTGITGIAMGVLPKNSAPQLIFRFLFSLSLLLFSLDLIKTGSSFVVTHELLQLAEGPLFFLLFGIIVTSLVQASSIVMVLALTALYTGSISFESACAVVLGGEIGTTLKFFIASAGSAPVKKRMALGNFFFNFFSAIIIFITLKYVTAFILLIAGEHNRLVALVLFQTLFNVFSLVLFTPWLSRIKVVLSRVFTHAEMAGLFIKPGTNISIPGSVTVLENEIRNFINITGIYIIGFFTNPEEYANNQPGLHDFARKTSEQQYQSIKQLHGLIQRFRLQVQKTTNDPSLLARIDGLFASARNIMYAAKSMHNIANDIRQFENSSKDAKYHYYLELIQSVPAFCKPLLELSNNTKTNPQELVPALTKIYTEMGHNYQVVINSLDTRQQDNEISNIEISTLLNCNRELYSAFKSLFYGVMKFLLSPDESAGFEKRPGFIR